MWTRYAFGDLPKKSLLDLHKLRRLNHVQNLLNLAEEHNLLLRARLWPKLEQTANHGLRKRGVLLKELHDTVRKLGVIQR